jgi:starvation-inducible DNA-binding protein
MRPSIGLTDEQRAEVVDILHALLADEYVLYTKTRNYHWNVTGMHFNDLHKFFEAQYEELDTVIDEVAERVRALGSKTIATLSEFSNKTRLSERPGEYPNADTMLKNLLLDHEAIITNLRKDLQTCNDLNDAGTGDFLTGLMEQHEKMAWMVRAFLE